jgi:hypothetical protein
MSDLSHNLNGERFEVPAAAVGWRVRKLQGKAAPEVVYGREGIPLVVPVDADMADLRREVGGEGRFRLDAVDGKRRAIPGCPPGYVRILASEEPHEAPGPGRRARPVPGWAPADVAILEAMRINSELARAVIDKFPMMLESAAVLLRAAGDAGMTRRPPPVLEVPSKDADGEDAVAPAGEGKADGLEGVLEKLVNAAAPAIVEAIMSRMAGRAGGHSAQAECHPEDPSDWTGDATVVSTQTTVAATHPCAPGSGSRSPTAAALDSPALVAAAGDVERGEALNAALELELAVVAAGDGEPGEVPSAAAELEFAGAAAGVGERGGAPSAALELELAGAAHFASIQQALTPREGLLVSALVAELSPTELRAWITG